MKECDVSNGDGITVFVLTDSSDQETQAISDDVTKMVTRYKMLKEYGAYPPSIEDLHEKIKKRHCVVFLTFLNDICQNFILLSQGAK